MKEVLERREERTKGRKNVVLAEGVFKLGIQGEQPLEQEGCLGGKWVMRILQFYSFYMTPWCFVKEIYSLKFLAKPFPHLCSSLTSTISCGARKAPVQIAAFRSHSLTE